MPIKQSIATELIKLSQKPWVNITIYRQFYSRLRQTGGLIRAQNPQDHFCVFFLPVNLNQKLLYLGFHKKAGSWIPPGGHIEPGESPIETVKREMEEELGFEAEEKDIDFADITVIYLKNLKTPCKIHWDLWFTVSVPQVDFQFDQREFYEAGWLTRQEAEKKMTIQDYRGTVVKIAGRLDL